MDYDFNYDVFFEDVSHVKSIHDNVASLKHEFQNAEDQNSWWLLQVGRISVNTQRISNLFWPVATHFAKQKEEAPDELLFDYQCLTLPSVIFETLNKNYLDVLHRHIEARICIDVTELPLTQDQKNMARRLYCCGYMLSMAMCVNMHRVIDVPAMKDKQILQNKKNADNFYTNIVKPSLVDIGVDSFMSPYTYNEEKLS